MNQFMGWSFPLGRLFGIPIKVHWTLLALAAVWVLSEPTPRAMGWTLAVCGVLFVTVLVHELGHAFAARGVGGEAHEILLWPLGGLAFTSHRGSLSDDIKVVLGGPLTHIPLAVLFARLLVFQGVPWDWQFLHPLASWPALDGGFWAYLCFYALKIQVALFLFNLFVPTYPLDGGQLLADLLLFRLSRERTAQVIMVCSLLSGIVLLALRQYFIALWVLFEAYQLWQFAGRRALGSHPLFARVPDGAKGKPTRKPGGSVVLPFRKRDDSASSAMKECPFCQRKLPVSAKMCGQCEKMLP